MVSFISENINKLGYFIKNQTVFEGETMKRNLAVAMFGQKRIPSREGGVEIVVEELAIRMVQMGHNVTCYNRRGHHVGGAEFDIQSNDHYQGIRIRSVDN